MTIKGISLLCALLSANAAASASATTLCPAHVVEVKSTSDGSVEFHFDQAAPVALPSNYPARDILIAIALTAISFGQPVNVIFGTDNAGCSANSAPRGDFSSLSLVRL